ncbi:unnamed protein product [Lactuca virosa]|uniref:Dirigent protein n=1 Tax=Lactuca virosa TaxID=75947 RepID=A0AAU9NJ18_9ASTR|nr:unnamed protein product [Lactuca virosa]
MGCGVSRSNEGLVVFRSPHHSKPQTHPPKLLIEEPSNLHQPPELQKINIAYHDGNGNDDPLWVGSPSFREYVQSFPEDDDVATSGDVRGKEIVIGTRGGEKLICNGEVCVRGDLAGKEEADTRGGRYRKVFQVHRVTFWHGRAWHPGHPKATRKAAGASS